jgi:hypothetical protein
MAITNGFRNTLQSKLLSTTPARRGPGETDVHGDVKNWRELTQKFSALPWVKKRRARSLRGRDVSPARCKPGADISRAS